MLPVIMPHFADRLNTEKFIILDINRQLAGVYQPDTEWFLTDAAVPLAQLPSAALTEGDGYAGLWKTFVHSIAIAERTNPRCQQTNLPLRFRSLMTEF